MTTAEMLQAVNHLIDDPQTDAGTRFALRPLADGLTEKVRADAVKTQGCGNTAAILERMFKSGDRTGTRGAWMDENGRQCACDGFRAYRLKTALPLTEIEQGTTPIQLDKIIDPLIGRRENISMPAPSVKDIKERLALNRARNGRKAATLYDFGRGLPVVDARFLLEMLTVFPDAKIYSTGLVSPLYVESERGDGVLLPVRGNKAGEQPTAATIITSAREKNPDAPEISLRDLAIIAAA